MSFFRHDLGDGLDLVLRDETTIDPMLALTLANLPRLQRWEPWASLRQTRASAEAHTRTELAGWLDGTRLPAAIRAAGRYIGSAGLRIERQLGSAEIGYWVDGSWEGRGVVSRAATALADHALLDLGLERVEIRTATHNARSRAVAERIGFTHERTMPRALAVRGQHHDLAVYVRLRTEHASPRTVD